MDFENLKKDWKNIIPPEGDPQKNMRTEVYSGIIEKIKAVEKKRKKTLIWLLITMPLTLIVIWYVMISAGLHETTTYVGLGFLNLAMIGYTLLVFINKSNVKVNNINDAAYEYLKKTSYHLGFRKLMILYATSLYGILLLAGLILMYQEILGDASIEFKAIAYLVVTVYCVAMMIWGIRRELKKFEKDVQPILNDINNLLQDLRSQ